MDCIFSESSELTRLLECSEKVEVEGKDSFEVRVELCDGLQSVIRKTSNSSATRPMTPIIVQE